MLVPVSGMDSPIFALEVCVQAVDAFINIYS